MFVNRSSWSIFTNIDKNSFLIKNTFRKHPILAGFHRSLDGAILGVILCVSLMSALALHSQYLWTLSFSRLEKTRDLNKKLEESITNLELYFLETTNLSKTLVPTKATDLLYLDALKDKKNSSNTLFLMANKFWKLSNYPIRDGY